MVKFLYWDCDLEGYVHDAYHSNNKTIISITVSRKRDELHKSIEDIFNEIF